MIELTDEQIRDILRSIDTGLYDGIRAVIAADRAQREAIDEARLSLMTEEQVRGCKAMTRELLKQALNALNSTNLDLHADAVEAIRAHLAQPQGEPVAWKWRYADGYLSESPFESRSECERDAIGYEGEAIPLFTHPAAPQAQPERKPMGNPEAVSIIEQAGFKTWGSMMFRIIRLVEAFHGIKETP